MLATHMDAEKRYKEYRAEVFKYVKKALDYPDDLLMEEVRKCEKMALNIYGHGVGYGSHWTVEAMESKSAVASYQKQLVLDAYRGALGSNKKTNNEFLELAANLDQNDREIAQEFTERILRSCMKK